MYSLNPHQGSRTPVEQPVGGAYAPSEGGAAGFRLPAAGGQASREAAGLVLFKTSPGQTSATSPLQRQNDRIIIGFDKPTRKLKRLKRLKSSVWLAGQLQKLPRDGFRPDQAHFVTLTYRDDDAWCPNHIAEATDRFRAWCKRRGVECRYTWVTELTKRGRVHYHLIAWLPVGVRMTFWDKPRKVKGKKTVPFWTHGMSNTQTAKHGVAYLMKYLSKMGEFHEFPDGLRLHGTGGLTKEGRAIRTWQNLPQWVKNDHGVGDIKRTQFGYTDMTTGEILPPMWKSRKCPGGVEITRLRDMTEKIYDHGPYSTYPRSAAG